MVYRLVIDSSHSIFIASVTGGSCCLQVEDAAPLANPAVIDSSPGSTSPGIPLSTSVASTPVSKDCSMPASRPSAHVSPFSSTSSSDVNTFTHSVINIDDGTSSRQFSSQSMEHFFDSYMAVV